MKSLKKTGSIFILCAISVAASIITAWQFMQIYATVTLPVEYCILGAVCGTLIAIAMYIIVNVSSYGTFRHGLRL